MKTKMSTPPVESYINAMGYTYRLKWVIFNLLFVFYKTQYFVSHHLCIALHNWLILALCFIWFIVCVCVDPTHSLAICVCMLHIHWIRLNFHHGKYRSWLHLNSKYHTDFDKWLKMNHMLARVLCKTTSGQESPPPQRHPCVLYPITILHLCRVRCHLHMFSCVVHYPTLACCLTAQPLSSCCTVWLAVLISFLSKYHLSPTENSWPHTKYCNHPQWFSTKIHPLPSHLINEE